MARLIAAVFTGALLLALAAAADRSPHAPREGFPHAPREDYDEPAKGEGQAQAEFKAAGVCARCHVVSVLEWGISGHVAAGTTCQNCHGPSKDHVANERNEVK